MKIILYTGTSEYSLTGHFTTQKKKHKSDRTIFMPEMTYAGKHPEKLKSTMLFELTDYHDLDPDGTFIVYTYSEVVYLTCVLYHMINNDSTELEVRLVHQFDVEDIGTVDDFGRLRFKNNTTYSGVFDTCEVTRNTISALRDQL